MTVTLKSLRLGKMWYYLSKICTAYEVLCAYVFGFLARGCKKKYPEPIPLDPRERIVFEDYMLKKDLAELRDIFTYVRKKENAIKEKCTKKQV